eukprot:TRINITY_DN28646_c0_g1_i1.p1 TRINITY_DN28646_c0_g1~~TRINITY_DN28646_c0_g1_i1.p1  ORF type:complete len:131 (-),score=29.22 TRINITY_DN28646_c0_g1_i1:78-470(-)
MILSHWTSSKTSFPKKKDMDVIKKLHVEFCENREKVRQLIEQRILDECQDSEATEEVMEELILQEKQLERKSFQLQQEIDELAQNIQRQKEDIEMFLPTSLAGIRVLEGAAIPNIDVLAYFFVVLIIISF